jgi:hypothetical protein
MGEGKRKRAARAMMEQIRDTYFDMLGEPGKHGAPLNRPQMLALLVEKAMLLGGFDEDEQNQLVELMEEVEHRLDTMQPIGEVAQRVVDKIPEPPKRPIDPERMRLVEERGRSVAEFVKRIVGNELGWIVLLFATGDAPELTYLSNCAREDCVKLLREYIDVLDQRHDFPAGVLTQKPH